MTGSYSTAETVVNRIGLCHKKPTDQNDFYTEINNETLTDNTNNQIKITVLTALLDKYLQGEEVLL